MSDTPMSDYVVDADSVHDLRPLAWILDQVHDAVDEACKAVKLFAHEHRNERTVDAKSTDVQGLRAASHELHRVVGALEMIEEMIAARMARAMEDMVRSLVERPAACTQVAAETLEAAAFALVDYLRDRKGTSPRSALGLFPQYARVQELTGATRVHPADLWPIRWQVRSVDLPPLEVGADRVDALRQHMNRKMLEVLREGSRSAAGELRTLFLAEAVAAVDPAARAFYTLCAAVFEGLEQAALALDVYVKRVISRVLLQCRQLADGSTLVDEHLLLDLLFFCEQAQGTGPAATPLLTRVGQAWELAQAPVPSYKEPVFGLYDPQVLLQCRRRVRAAKESWSALVEGNVQYLPTSTNHLRGVAESVNRLGAVMGPLAEALDEVVGKLGTSEEVPVAALGMEVATTLLFLEAMLEHFRPSDAALAGRIVQLADRLHQVLAGGQLQALDPWMETLYRDISDRQNIDTVVGELRVTLGEVEQNLDQFFRRPEEREHLNTVPGLLAQMRGVLSVLGVEHAVSAMVRMRADVEQLRAAEQADLTPGLVEKLGNSLGVLGFLLDTLGYQPALARQLFFYDAQAGELKFAGEPARTGAAVVTAAPAAALAGPVHEPVPDDAGDAGIASAVVAQEDAAAEDLAEPTEEEHELLDVFLEEARGVIANGLSAVRRLTEAPSDVATLTDLRRAFHTLKGSARMVGLEQFSAAAWSLEQLFNGWLAKGLPASEDLRAVADAALQAQGHWVVALENRDAQAWRARPFDEMADALRIHGERNMVPLEPASAALQQDVDTSTPPVPGADAEDGEPAPEQAAPSMAPDTVWAESDPGALETTDDTAFAVPEGDAAPEDTLEPESMSADDLETAMPRFLHSSEFPDLSFASSEFNLLDLGEDAAWDAEVPAQAFADTRLIETPGSDALEGDEAAAAEEAPAEALMQPLEPQDIDGVEDGASAAAGVEPPPQPEVSPEVHVPELVRVGHLQLSHRLFDAYAEEATDWAGRLLADVRQWQGQPDVMRPDVARTSAHALAGSSATVGFSALAELAHEVEHALARLEEQEHARPAQLAVLLDAAQAVQRAVAAFAAGHLEAPPAETTEAVRKLSYEAPEVAASEPMVLISAPDEPAAPPASEAEGVDDGTADDGTVATRFANSSLSDELWPIFEEEAGELLENLSTAMRRWAEVPADSDAHRQVLRILHTLKGSARLAEASELGDLVHETESVIESYLRERSVAAAPSDEVVHQVDRIHALFDRLRGHHEQAPAAFGASGFAFNQTSLAALADDEEFDTPEPDPAPEPVTAPVGSESEPTPPQAPPVDLPPPTVLVPDMVNAADRRRMVRVRASLLDHLMAQLGELVISRASLEEDIRRLRSSLADLASSIANLRRHLREVEMQAETQMQTRLAQNSEIDDKFDPLEFDRYTRMQELTRMLAEAVDDVATVQRSLQRSVEAGEDDLAAQVHQSRELQHALLRARMVEFEAVSERLYRLVRQAADETGKQVSLRILGGDLELDRSVLDRLTAVFEHLLRNSIVHGISTPAQRATEGKEETGHIVLSAMPAGPDVVFEIQDDGAGLDMDRIREGALKHGRIDPAQIPSDHELAQLIFEPWFSTATVVTELAGRGVGLDVVRSEVRALGGHVAVASRPGKGATFRLVVPATQALTQVTLVRMGVMAVGIPSSLIDSVQEVVARKLTQAYEDGSMELDGQTRPFFWVGALLQHSRRGRVDPNRPSTVIVCRSAEQKIVVHVDEVMDELEVVIKPLGAQLSRLPGLVAVTVLANGSIALIYNPVALANVYEQEVRALMMSAPTPADVQPVLPLGPQPTEAAGKALILVVDDSITVRRVMERLLQRNGYRVALASDGLEGLAMLRDERPAVVLSDIEMPNMDGYDFVRQIRADPTLDTLPVVMITSRAAEKHRTYAMELGANDYLGKPYSEAELLKLLENYTQKDERGTAGDLAEA